MIKAKKLIAIISIVAISFSDIAVPTAHALTIYNGEEASAQLQEQVDEPVTSKTVERSAPAGVLGLGDFSTPDQSAQQRLPASVQTLDKKTYGSEEDVTVTVNNPDNEEVHAKVLNEDGEEMPVYVEKVAKIGETELYISPSNQFKPGQFTVVIESTDGEISKQDFTWGVLAINTDKPIYMPGEESFISLAVLDHEGEMVCDAELTLTITHDKTGNAKKLTTKDGQIIVNEECQRKEYTLKPDYETTYTFADLGDYTLDLHAKTGNGEYSIKDTVKVQSNPDFVIKRTSATRLYPPKHYPMIIEVTANKDFDGVITETVPDSFTITPGKDAVSYNDLDTVYLEDNSPEEPLQDVLGASTSATLVMPFDGDFGITQGFGQQLTDASLASFYAHYDLSGHDGVDFALPQGTPLYAVDDGQVLLSGDGDYGQTIVIQHSWGRTYYGHLSQVKAIVNTGVKKGQLIGYSGNTGESTGPHLHFGMKPDSFDANNGYSGKIDPLPYLPIGGSTILTEALPAIGAVLAASTSADATASAPADLITPTPSLPLTIASSSGTVASRQAVLDASASATVTASDSGTITASDSAKPFTLIDDTIEQIVEDDSPLKAKVKVLQWEVSLKKGQTVTLEYTYRAPDLSPQFYLLGPVRFVRGEDQSVVFEENRSWQLAGDAVASSVTFMDSGGDATFDDEFALSQFGDASVSTTQPHTGTRSYRFNTAGGTGAIYHFPGASTGNRISFWGYWESFPTGTQSMLQLYNGGTYVASPVNLTAGRNVNTSGGSDGSTTLTTGRWYHFVLSYTISSTTVNEFRLYVDGRLESSGTNTTISNATPDRFRLGIVDSSNFGSNNVYYADDIYVDNGTNLDSPGPVRVAHKRPFSNGSSNQWSSTGIGSGYGSGNAVYANQQPPTGDGRMFVTASNRSEFYNVEGPEAGDQDITGAKIRGYGGWLYVSKSGSGTGERIVINGSSTVITISGLSYYSAYTLDSSYPASTDKIGVISNSTGFSSYQLYEAGFHIAYYGPTLSERMRHGKYFSDGLKKPFSL